MKLLHNRKMFKTISRWGPVILWAGLIFTLSSISTLPALQINWWDFILKKSAHMLEYGIFYLLLVRALSRTLDNNRELITWNSSGLKINPINIKPQVFLFAFVIAVIYAASDEYHQSFTPGRTPKVTDVGFDTAGMLISFQLIRSRLKADLSR
jgi:VanZ family protein